MLEYSARPKPVLPSKIHRFIVNIPAVATPLGTEEVRVRVSEVALLPLTIIKHSHIRGFLGKLRLSEGVVLCSSGRRLLACDIQMWYIVQATRQLQHLPPKEPGLSCSPRQAFYYIIKV